MRAAATALVVATAAMIGLAHPTPASPPAPAHHVTEDDPRWICSVDGNRICGPVNVSRWSR